MRSHLYLCTGLLISQMLTCGETSHKKGSLPDIEYGRQLYIPENEFNSTFVYASDTFSCILQSRRSATYDQLEEFGTSFKEILYCGEPYLTFLPEPLKTFAALWAPIEKILNDIANDVHVSCIFIHGNTAFCMVRGYNGLLYSPYADAYSEPAVADILNWDGYNESREVLPKVQYVPLFGSIKLKPGAMLFGCSRTVAEKISLENVHTFLQRGYRTKPDHLVAQIVNTAFRNTPCYENAGAFIIRRATF